MAMTLRQSITQLREKLKTTLVPSEWERAVSWRAKWLDSEDEDKPRDLEPQIVAYLVADAETIRSLEPLLDELELAERPQSREASLVAGVYMDRSIADFQRSCEAHIAEEQRKPSPDTALIALLCDAVRCSRELTALATKPVP